MSDTLQTRHRGAGARSAHIGCCPARRGRLPVPLLLHGRRLAARDDRSAICPPRSRPALTGANYTAVNGAISLGRSLLNSGIMTIGVLLCTLVFGVLAGYALAQLRFRGRGAVFAALLLVQTIPFQLLTLPLYVLVVRDYGLGDNYLGMILPFAINSTAVFLFRQFFLPAAAVRSSRRRGSTGRASCGSCGRSRCRWHVPRC